jgi:hypothetical protein
MPALLLLQKQLFTSRRVWINTVSQIGYVCCEMVWNETKFTKLSQVGLQGVCFSGCKSHVELNSCFSQESWELQSKLISPLFTKTYLMEMY